MFALPAGPLVRWRGGVIAAWAALALLFAPRASHVQQVLALRGGASETTESARASELLKQAFPSPFADYVAIVVHGPVRWTNQRFGVVLDTLKAATERRPYVSQVISVRSIGESSFVSQDRRTTFLIAALTPEFTSDINKSVIPDLRDKIRNALAQAPGADGFDVKVTGFPALDHDVRTISAEDTERGEARALPLTLVVLVVAFGAMVAAMLPVIVGVLAITIALGLVTVAANYLPMSVFVLNITTMVGLGVGIDYSLLIVTRFREELNRGLSPVDAAVRTIETAGSAVLTSGITVGVRFAALVTTPLSDTRPGGAGGLRVGLAALRDMGASGVIQPIRVVVQLPEGESALAGRRLPGLKALTDSLRKDPRVREVRGVASIRPGLSSLQLALYYSDVEAVRAKNPQFFGAYLSADQRITLLDVIPADTVSLAGMMDVARHVRAVVARGVRGLAGTEIVVGGFAASNVDTQQELLRRFPQTVGLVLGITAIMLFGAFRSLLVPLQAVLLNCLSVGAPFGLTVIEFQYGYGGRLFGLEGPTEAIWVVVPVLVFAIVFGLSMDYEVFLLTRVKEVFDKTGRNDHATMEGLSATASTITSAALIMILVFGTFAFARVLAVQLVGFGLAAAVLLDATLIRMVLVPAIMHIAGRWNWWPGVKAKRREKEA